MIMVALANWIVAVPPVGAQPEPCPAALSPSNPNATPAARRVLEFLRSLPERPDNRVVAGQFGAYGEGAGVPEAVARLQKVFDQTGKWVGLTGMDYRNWDINHGSNLAIPNAYLTDQWNAGGLVTISWHPINPWTSGPSTDWEHPKGSGYPPFAGDIAREGTAVNSRWMLILSHLADGLQELRDAGVVVLWRPFHEMNGGWFWWGRQNKQAFTDLWRHMYDYFTKERKLDNLLWVYSPAIRYNQWMPRTSYFWPGDQYVDVVGLSKYRRLDESTLQLDTAQEYSDLLTFCKPFGLFEFGPTPAESQPDAPRWDYSHLIRDIRERYPMTVLFQAWEWHWALGEHLNADRLLNDSWVLTRDELPNFREP
jgi:mannan endo-1,4-beta-mannosidase